MTLVVKARFDGEVFRPEGRVDLPPETHVNLTIQAEDIAAGDGSFLETAAGLNLEGPEDFSERFEDYLAALRAQSRE